MSPATAMEPAAKTGTIFLADTYNIKANAFDMIDGPSFEAEMHRLLPWVKNHTPLPDDNWSQAVALNGSLRFGVRTFKTTGRRYQHRFDFKGSEGYNTLDVYPGGKRATVAFTTDVQIPVIARMGQVVMSFTPMEVISMRVGWKRAKGNVLIGGLGLGMIARQALLRKSVKHVTVVELSQAVIDLVGPSLIKEFGDRVTIKHGDIYDHLLTGCTQKDISDAHYKRLPQVKKLVDTRWLSSIQYDQILIDIWDGVSGKYDDPIFEDLTANVKEVWGWGYKTYNDSRF